MTRARRARLESGRMPTTARTAVVAVGGNALLDGRRARHDRRAVRRRPAARSPAVPARGGRVADRPDARQRPAGRLHHAPLGPRRRHRARAAAARPRHGGRRLAGQPRLHPRRDAAGRAARGRPRPQVVAMLTHTVVDPDDPAFARADEADRQLLRRGRRAPPAPRQRLGGGRGLGPRLAAARRLAAAACGSSSRTRSRRWSTRASSSSPRAAAGSRSSSDADGRLRGRRGRDRQGLRLGAARPRGRRRPALHHDRRRPGRRRTSARPDQRALDVDRRRRRRAVTSPTAQFPRRQHGPEDRGGARLPRGGRRRGAHHEPRPPRRRARRGTTGTRIVAAAHAA